MRKVVGILPVVLLLGVAVAGAADAASVVLVAEDGGFDAPTGQTREHDRSPPEKTASVATVTAQESQAFRKKPGGGLFTLGLCAAPLGGSVGWSYEAHTWRLGTLFQGARDDPPYFGLEGAWVPLEGESSPYVRIPLPGTDIFNPQPWVQLGL
jgi:hypothetical protein